MHATESASAAHWRRWYETHPATSVSWYQLRPDLSLRLIAACAEPLDAPIIDIGGGASTLVDALLGAGHTNVTVLDIAPEALAAARSRLGASAARVEWVATDLLTWRPSRRYAVWHDRAVLHFMTEPAQRDAYLTTLRATLAPRGHVILATFAPDGPDRCSGQPVRRYDAAQMAEFLGPDFRLMEEAREDHHTPAGAVQRFAYARFRLT